MTATPNLIFSARAMDRLQAVIADEEDSDQLKLRVSVLEDEGETRFGFSLERNVGADDVVMEFGALDVLLDASSAAQLNGSEIDYIDDDEGERFIVRSQR